MKKLLLLLLPALLCGCPELEGQSDEFSHTYTYDMYDPTCEYGHTGFQMFHSLNELCRCLQDDELNHYCARTERQNEFALRCHGVYTIVQDCQDP